MENLNAEYIKVALKCHSDPKNKCEICPYNKKCCSMALANDALALINSQEQRIGELAKENEEHLDTIASLEIYLENSKTNTVRKMQERLKKDAITIMDHTGKLGVVVGVGNIDDVAKEMLGEEK